MNKTNENKLSIPLIEFFKSDIKDNPLELFQRLFPQIKGNDLEAVHSIRVGIRLNRNNSALVKYVRWRQSSETLENGFDESAMRGFIDAIQSLTKKLGGAWDPTVNGGKNLDIVSDDISYNWDYADENKVPNKKLWEHFAKQSSLYLQDPANISFDDSSVDDESISSFKVKVFPALVNPDDESEIFQIGEEIQIPKGLDQDQFISWWDNTLQEKMDDFLKEFEINDFRKVFQPKVSLIANIFAPDGAPLKKFHDKNSSLNNISSWTKWINKRVIEVDEAYKDFAQWYVTNSLAEGYSRLLETDKEVVGSYLRKGKKVNWNLIERKAENLEQADEIIAYLPSYNENQSSLFRKHIIQYAHDNFNETAWMAGSFKRLPLIREIMSNKSWVDDEFLEDLIKNEKDQVHKILNKFQSKDNLSSFIKSLSLEDRQTFRQVAVWNGYRLDKSHLDLIFNREVVEDEPEIIVEKGEVKKGDKILSDTDWSDLLVSYGIEKQDLEALQFYEDENGEIVEEPPHPFINWIDRLSPPDKIKTSTLQWVVDNETFNDLNRIILRQTDTDDAQLSAQLIEKLKNVMDASNEVMSENLKSGGWWSRVRKNMTSENGAGPEKWADAFMDFQDHMLKMFDSVNKQIERDKIWLSHAVDISQSSSKLSKSWNSWIKSNAKELMKEHEDIQNGYKKIQEGEVSSSDPTEGELSERKVEWNNKMAILESAQSMRTQIKKANDLNNVFLEKIKMSTETKERLQQRTMIFYWSTLNMFAGLQSIQRNTNSIYNQADMVKAMSDSIKAMSTRSFKEEAQQKEKIKEAFKEMAASEKGMQDFYKNIASFQKDTVAILSDLNASREDLQIDTVEISMSGERLENKRQVRENKRKMSVSMAEPMHMPRLPGMDNK